MPTPSFLTHLNLIDLIVVVVVALGAVGALRRRAGLLAALAGGAVTLATLWLVAVALVAWGPGDVSRVTADSTLVSSVPYPQRAVEQAGTLIGADPRPARTTAG